MKRKASRSIWMYTTALACLVMLPALALAQDRDTAEAAEQAIFGRTYEVTITNITHGQIISPPIVYAHRGRFELFSAGDEAIPELAAVAEDADNAGLVALLTAEPWVSDVAVGGAPLLPGESMTLELVVRGGFRHVSALGMLVTTNDAFFFGSRYVPAFGGATYAIAWDAGSEANTESCEHIPGPPCGNGGVRVTDGAEGYIHVHAGIHGGASLEPAIWDWRNPVAKIEIERAIF